MQYKPDGKIGIGLNNENVDGKLTIGSSSNVTLLTEETMDNISYRKYTRTVRMG